MNNQRLTGTTFAMMSVVCIFFAFAAAQPLVVPSEANPTIAKAIAAARTGDTIIVENGVYNQNIRVKSGVMLKARAQFKAILDGGGKGNVVTLQDGAGICGFEIRMGTIGVQSSGLDNAILNCRITGMSESGISCTGQLPRIEDNVIVYNKGSGIQGWNLQPTATSITHNTIAYNANNGIGIGGNSKVTIDHNIIAFNQRLGIKISDESTPTAIRNNVFFQNGSMPYIKLEGNSICDPRFVEPKKMQFSLQPDSPCLQKGSNEDVPGARGGI
jgi:nitrous oxidase accessory protein NosD